MPLWPLLLPKGGTFTVSKESNDSTNYATVGNDIRLLLLKNYAAH